MLTLFDILFAYNDEGVVESWLDDWLEGWLFVDHIRLYFH